jgi:hypothetical protein
LVAIGIDLGTAFARAAVVRDGGRELLQFHDGARNLPAVVAMGRDGVRVGRVALARATTEPTSTVRAIKRLLGRSIDDPVIKALAVRSPFGLEAGPAGEVALKLGGKTVEAVDVAAELLRHIVQVAEQQCGEPPSSGVLTIPYWYGSRQRKALSLAAQRAGLAAMQVLSEATCTALSLLDTSEADRLVAIVDAGAGGCTASVLELGPRRVRLVATSGDPLGGGEDIDWAMARAVFKGLKTRFGEFDASPSIVEMLRQTCEAAKQSLSQMASVTAFIPFLPIGAGVVNQQVDLDRETASVLMRDTTLRVGAACREALKNAGGDKSRLAAVYATGGSAKLPAVRAAIEDVLGKIASRKLDPDGSVALGAAYQAAMLVGEVESIPVLDVQTNLSIAMPAVEVGSPVSAPPAQIRSAYPSEVRSHDKPSSAPPTVRSQSVTMPATPVVSTVPAARAASSGPAPVRTSSSAPAPARGGDAPAEPLNVESFRMELAGLLASLRAGAVTDAGARKKSHVHVRTNDINPEPADLDKAAIERNAAQLQTLWGHLAAVMQTVRQYRWEHPQTVRALDRAIEELKTALEQAPTAVAWDVGTMRFAYHEIAVWTPDRAPYDRIPYELFAEGIRKVQLQPGLTAAELRDFLGVLLRDAALGFGADDDAATALWDRKFAHVGWLAVDAFSEGDDPVFQEQRDEIAKQLAELAALSEEGEQLMEAYAVARREATEATGTLAVDEILRASLMSRIDPVWGEWLDRYAAGYSLAWKQGRMGASGPARLGPLPQWTERQVAAHASATAFELFHALHNACGQLGSDATDFTMQVTGAMFPPTRFAAVLQDLKDDPEPGAGIVEGLKTLLSIEQGDALVRPIHESFAVLPEPVRDAAVGLVARHAAGHEAVVGHLLTVAEPAHAHTLIMALRNLGSPQALAAVCQALSSPHTPVRMEGLAALPEAPSDRVRADVEKLVADADPVMRQEVLRTVAERKVLAAGPALTRRIQDDKFLELPAEERRLLLEAVGALNRRRADDLAIDWLDRQQVFRTDALEQTRAMAAEFLAGSESTEALDALQRAAKKRLFSSQAVRDTAQRGAEVVQSRRSSLPPSRSRGS